MKVHPLGFAVPFCETALERPRHPPAARGFSILELLVVVAILTVLIALCVPAFDQIVSGSRITVAGTAVIDELNLARQAALSRNLPVEVRFYKLPAADAPANAAPTVYRAMQSFIANGSQQVPLGKAIYLPPGIVIEQSTDVSSIFLPSSGPLSDPAEKTPEASTSLPQYQTNYRYVSFRFKGDGATDMNEKPAFLTLITERAPKSANGLPKNFITVQIDPVNGRARTYRP